MGLHIIRMKRIKRHVNSALQTHSVGWEGLTAVSAVWDMRMMVCRDIMAVLCVPLVNMWS